MPVASVSDFLLELQRLHLLSAERWQELETWERPASDARLLAREMVQRGWLTPFQCNQIFLGRGKDLLLGSYVLMEKVGEGGMGAVYKAQNWKLGRVVALKLIRKERLENAQAVTRFQREIRAAAQLQSSHIVRAYDADASGDYNFFVMEYVPGRDLAKIVREKGPLPIRDACEYVRQAALGLQHAYERGLVHRDIKPSNLLVAESGEATVKILDLGLVRREHIDGHESGTITHVGSVMGTPDYISPEQSLESHRVDIRSDLYSLGCTFYFLLTGQVPYPGGSLVEKLVKHQLNEPERIEKLRPETPAAVATILRKMMAKRPEARYQTPVELAVALEQHLSGAAVEPTEEPAPVSAPVPQPEHDVATDPDLSSLETTLPSVQHMKLQEERQKQLWRIFTWSGIGAAIFLVLLVIILLVVRP